MSRSGEGCHTADALIVSSQSKGNVASQAKCGAGDGVLFFGQSVDDRRQVGQPLRTRECSGARTNSRHCSGGHEPSRFVGEVLTKFRQHACGSSAHAERPWQAVKQYECSLDRCTTFRLKDVKIEL
jgi:hypothetical protein